MTIVASSSTALVPTRVEIRPAPVRLTSPSWDVAVARFLEWLALVRGRAPSTVMTYARGLRGFIRFARAQDLRDPRAVTFREIEDYLGLLGSQGRQASLLNQHLAAIRAFYRYLEREGVVPNNPAALAVGPKKAHRLPEYLTVPEQERLLAWLLAEATTPIGQRDHAMVATALFTGMRCEELVTLRLDAVSFDGGFLRIVGKGSKTREVPLIPRLAATLTTYLRETRPALLQEAASPYVFVPERRAGGGRHWRNGREMPAREDRQAGTPLATRSFYRMVRTNCSALVGRPVHPHMLRHSYASRLRANGADLQLIGEVLGHVSIVTTTMYAHISTPLRTATVARLLEDRS